MLPIPLIEGQNQELAEAVGVAVEGSPVDVRYRDPFPPEFVTERHCIAELLLKILHVGGLELAGGCALGNHLVGPFLKEDEIRLAGDQVVG